MSANIEQKARKAVETLDLPQDLFLGLPNLSLTGDRELYIMNHRGILNYEKESVTILAKNMQIQVRGRNLVIAAYSKDEIIIKGYIHSVEIN